MEIHFLKERNESEVAPEPGETEEEILFRQRFEVSVFFDKSRDLTNEG